MSTQTAILIGLILYACLMGGVSLFWMLRVKKAADYLVAGRGLPYLILTGTIVGTCIGTGVVIGASGLAYRHGWAGCAYPIGLGIGTLLTGLLFGLMRRYRFMTLSEEIACYYSGNRPVVEFCSLSLFFSQLCWLTVQIMGGGAVLSVVTGLHPKISVVLAGFITAVISIPGGLKTVVYTDFLQAIILLCGFGVLTQDALSQVGGLSGLRTAVPAGYFSFLGIDSYGSSGGWQVLSLLLVLITNPLSDPGRRQTLYSAQTERGAKWSMITAGVIVVIFSVVVGIAGMYTFKLNPNLPAPDQALPWLIMNVLPPWLAAVVVVSVTSAIFSSANGCAIAVGTFFVRHIHLLFTKRFPEKPLVAARRAMVCAFVLSTAIALYTKTIVGFVQKFLPLTMSGLAVIIVLGRLWKRATWQGALAALIATPAVSLFVMFVPAQAAFWGNPIIPASVAGVLAHVIISALTPPRPRSFEQVADALAEERRAVEGEFIEHSVKPSEPVVSHS